MDTSKFLQLVEEKKRRMLEKKEAPLKWEQKLEAAAKAKAEAEAKAKAERKRKHKKQKRRSDSGTDSDSDSDSDRSGSDKKRRKRRGSEKRHGRKHRSKRRNGSHSDSDSDSDSSYYSDTSSESDSEDSATRRSSHKRRHHRRHRSGSIQTHIYFSSVNLKERMATCNGHPRVDIRQINSVLQKQLGRQKYDNYTLYLKKLLSNKISKSEFERLCLGTLGKESIPLHNKLLQSILRNAITGAGPPPKETNSSCLGIATKTPSGHFGDALLSPSGKGKSISSKDRKFSSLRAQGKEALNGPAKAPLEVISVEDGEEVEQAKHSPGVQSRSPIKAPLGIIPNPRPVKPNRLTFPSESCSGTGELPSTRTLYMQLKRKCEAEGLNVTPESAEMLNRALDVYLKRLVKPSVDMVRAVRQKVVVGVDAQQSLIREMRNVTVHDFRVSMETNPSLLGEDRPVKLEKLNFACFQARN